MNRADVRRRWWAVVPTASLVAVVALTPTAAPVAAQEATPPSKVRFDATGGPQSWLVPGDVHQATFTVAGARGGDSVLHDGGYGGTATTSIAVTPGETLEILVGGRGADWESDACGMLAGGDDPTGGFNGGGDGGGGPGCHGGGGGGASDVRRGGSELGNRVIVAGGGGGAASSCSDSGGGGGTVGGSAGCGGGAGGDQDGSTGSRERGQGGTGGDASTVGSGGGGGYWGGAGGGENLGGGGGSGFGPAATVFETGVNAGPGFVTISFSADAPTVSGVSPNFGPARGGADTVITGSGFQAPGVPAAAVYFGTTQADPRQVSCTATECHVAAPPGTGTVNVRVEVSGQMSLDSPADDYTYFGDPTLTEIDPPTAWAGKGLDIVGTNFPPPPYANEVWFGSVGPSPTFDCISPTECSVDIPPGLGLGNVDVTVVTPQGRSNSVQFTLVPGVEQVSPPSGPAAGGTLVKIDGTGFDTTLGHTIFHFGDAEAEATGCSSTSSCIVVSPPGAGTVWVNATVDGWQSLELQGENQFTYTAGATESTIPVPVDVRFDEDSTALRPEDEPFLRSVATAVQGAPATATVTVEGHADSTGPADYNDDLSQRRAQAVTDWLVGTGGVAAERITAVAHGEHLPIASNDDAAGRAVNRRVTITVG